MYPITDPDDVAAAVDFIEKARIKRRFAAHGYVVTPTRDDVQCYQRIEEVMEKEGYFQRELDHAATMATTSRRTSDGTSVPDHRWREAELDKRDHAIMDAVPEKLTGWATSPLPKPVRWHAEWIAARQKYVRSGDERDLEAMRKFVTFNSPPLLADVRAAQAARPSYISASFIASFMVTMLGLSYLGVGWATDPDPRAIPFTVIVLAIITLVWVLRHVYGKRT